MTHEGHVGSACRTDVRPHAQHEVFCALIANTKNRFFVHKLRSIVISITIHNENITMKSSIFALVATMAITMPMKNRAELLRAASSSARSLSYELIAGYEPTSIVTDHVSCCIVLPYRCLL